MIKVGIMGGTFDPIHIGHLILAMEAMNFKKLDEVWFVPTGNPNFKQDKKITDKYKRLEMVKICTRDNEKFKVCEYEVSKNDVTYTWETMKYFRENFDCDFYFIMGEDSLMSVETWENAVDFLKNTKILACIRRQEEMSKLDEKNRWIKIKRILCGENSIEFCGYFIHKYKKQINGKRRFQIFSERWSVWIH